ncbi:hypothetical protein [Pseudomonas oryzicola]|uniref:hypothetical protein n=1 Tax=Pseudomonas oryzicola TaxID=485876 RepID=UPI001CEDB791|nr:hypothetical protein [Pseudomonas oryzicola]
MRNGRQKSTGQINCEVGIRAAISHTQLFKPIQRALNQIAHSRALLRQMEERERLSKEIDRLLASGLSAEALEQIRSAPPYKAPDY